MDNTTINKERFSTSEQHGLSYISDNDLKVFSPGVSTGGIAEMEMAKLNPKRKVIATTIDRKGLEFATEKVRDYYISEGRIELKLEDISKPLPYQDNYFDYIYARLVLHYLSKEDLRKTLNELHRILKPGKKLFIVVRSIECPEATMENSTYEERTGFTYYECLDEQGNMPLLTRKRYFHSKETISNHLIEAGFVLDDINQYDEQLYIDFKRSIIAPNLDNVIEVLAHKQ